MFMNSGVCCVVSPLPSPPSLRSALTALTSLSGEVAHTRARLGLPPPKPLTVAHDPAGEGGAGQAPSAGPPSTDDLGGGGASSRGEVHLMAEVGQLRCVCMGTCGHGCVHGDEFAHTV